MRDSKGPTGAPVAMGHRQMVGKPINLSYLVNGLHGLKIFEIRFGGKVHIVQGSNVNHKKYIASNCKKSCSIVEYSGEYEVNNPYNSMIPNWNMYIMIYVLSNQDFELIVYEQYLIYDTIGMMGSVGGTVGMFIWNNYLSYSLFWYFFCIDFAFIFRNVYWTLYDWPNFMDIFMFQKMQLQKNKF